MRFGSVFVVAFALFTFSCVLSTVPNWKCWSTTYTTLMIIETFHLELEACALGFLTAPTRVARVLELGLRKLWGNSDTQKVCTCLFGRHWFDWFWELSFSGNFKEDEKTHRVWGQKRSCTCIRRIDVISGNVTFKVHFSETLRPKNN